MTNKTSWATTRKCRDCRARKPLEEFPERNDPLTGRSVRRRICHVCWAARQAECYQQDELPRYADLIRAGRPVIVAAHALSRFRSVLHFRGILHPTNRLFCGRAWAKDGMLTAAKRDALSTTAAGAEEAAASSPGLCRDCLSELALFLAKLRERHGLSLTALGLLGDTPAHELSESGN